MLREFQPSPKLAKIIKGYKEFDISFRVISTHLWEMIIVDTIIPKHILKTTFSSEKDILDKIDHMVKIISHNMTKRERLHYFMKEGELLKPQKKRAKK